MRSDSLYKTFIHLLNDTSKPQETETQLIFEVVAQHIFELMLEGNVPHHTLDDLESFLKDEVTDIYRKKTYGFRTLQDYRAQRMRSQA